MKSTGTWLWYKGSKDYIEKSVVFAFFFEEEEQVLQ